MTTIKTIVINHNLKNISLISLRVITEPKHKKDTSTFSVFQHSSYALFVNQLIDWIIFVPEYPIEVNSTFPLKPPPCRNICSEKMD